MRRVQPEIDGWSAPAFLATTPVRDLHRPFGTVFGIMTPPTIGPSAASGGRPVSRGPDRHGAGRGDPAVIGYNYFVGGAPLDTEMENFASS
jgi:hypothetical protein